MFIDPNSLDLYLSPNAKKTQEQADKAFAVLLADEDPATFLHDIVGNGFNSYMKWKIEELKKQITAQTMAAKGVSENDLAAMKPEDRLALQDQIMREVQEKLKEAIREEMKREKKLEVGLANAPPLSTATLHTLLNQQEATPDAGPSPAVAAAGTGESTADRRARTHFRLDLDLTAMQFNEPLHEAKP